MTDAAADGSQNQGSSDGGASTPQWTEGFSDSQMAIVQNKGWSSPSDMANGYEHASKFIGGDPSQLVKMPSADDADGYNELYSKLGRPEKADGYSFKMADEMGGDNFTGWMKDTAYKIGLSDKQAGELAESLNQFNSESMQNMQSQSQANTTTQINELKTEWGAAHDKNTLQAKVAAQSLGISEDQIKGIESELGYKETMKLFQKLGEKVGEANFQDGTDNQGFQSAMTPEQAKSEISRLMTDKDFMNAWSNKFAPGHKEAVEKKAQLMGLAHG